jgi:putative ABC transport system substrate-binding protein
VRRRQFVFAVATFNLLTGCAVLPILGTASLPGVVRIGILSGSAADVVSKNEIDGLKQGLGELGYMDGQSILFEERDAGGNDQLLPRLVDELLRLPVDVLVVMRSQRQMQPTRRPAVYPLYFWITLIRLQVVLLPVSLIRVATLRA